HRKGAAAGALGAWRAQGAAVKVITGDDDIVTRRVCRDVDLPVERLLLGEEIDTLSDSDLARVVEGVTVFARVNPVQKARIIRALQQRGHTVLLALGQAR